MEEVKVWMAKIDKSLRRNIALILSVIAFCFVVCIAAVVFYRPTVKFDTSEIMAKEKERIALERQNESLHNLVIEQQRAMIIFTSKDSALINEIRLNREAIDKIKLPNEKIFTISNYGSADLQRYFANLPDPR